MTKKTFHSLALAALAFLVVSCASGPGGDMGMRSNVDARKIDTKSRDALNRLYSSNPVAKDLANHAAGILVFPEMTKGGVVIAGAWGDGALYQRGRSAGYYRSITASYGLQAGLQEYGYALFLMDENAIRNLNRSGGWELGSSPNLTIIDQGVAGTLSTTTMGRGTFAIFFDQKGLMAGLALDGTKITRLAIQP